MIRLMSELPKRPEHFHTVSPYLVLQNASEGIEFYKRAFGAEEIMRLDGPGGMVAHAEIKIGDSAIMLADEMPQMGFLSPQAIGGCPIGLMIYTKDADAMFAKAIAEGATEDRPLMDQFYGDRSGTVLDPYGYTWTLATHIEDVTLEEVKARMAKMMGADSEG